MRKIFSIFLIFVLAASLSACGSAPTPKDIVEKYFAAIKAQDEEGISALSEGSYSEDELMGTVDLVLGESEEGEEYDEATKKFKEKVIDFDYTIGEERIDGENAEVDVTIKTYDFGTMLGQYAERAMSELMAAAVDGASQEEIDAMDRKILEEELDKLTEKSYETTVPMKLKKVEGEWKVAAKETDRLNPVEQNAARWPARAVAQFFYSYQINKTTIAIK